MRAREFETVPAKKILSYVKNIQGDGHFYMDDLITRYPRWQLTQVPLSKLKINPDPEIKNPLGTNIHIDLDYVDSISPQDIARKPIVADPSGWIIDGNHRATAAQQQGLATIPAYVPVKDIAENMDHSRDGSAVAELKSALLAKRDQLQSATDDQVYDIIDKIMTRIARSHSISGQKLHDMWVDKYKQIPDTWIMNEEQGVAENKQPGKPVVDAILKVMPLAQEIWFHGSRAIGQHRNDSDTDILVVVPDDLVGDKYFGVVRILQKLSSHFDNYDIQPTKAGTNIHRIAQEEGRLLWSKNQGVAEDTQLPGDFKLMGQNLFLKNLARNLKQRYPDATVKLSSDRVTAYHNERDDEHLTVMGTEVMDSGYIGVGLDDAFTESFQGVLVPTIKQTTEQLLAANPGTKPALFLSTDNWNPDAWTHIASKLGYRLVADDEPLAEGAKWDDEEDALVEALESWMMMDYDSQTIQTILSSPEAESYKQPPNVQWLYRAIVPRDREINSIKAQGPVVAFATEMTGAITFIQSLETTQDWVIIRKPFDPADFLLDFTGMYEDIVEPDHMSRYEVEHEVWMKSVPAYTKANKQEIVYTSKQHYGDDDWRKKNSEPKVAGPAVADVATIKKNPERAYLYALATIKGRWPEAEPVIMKKPAVALKYAKNIIHGRWPEAEPEIMKDPDAARKYSQLFNLDTPAQNMAENFADGRNPGRKGLAKRSGVNTKASVSTLRNVAKHSSGEKQRMAHWLANMKAGRAKARKK